MKVWPKFEPYRDPRLGHPNSNLIGAETFRKRLLFSDDQKMAAKGPLFSPEDRENFKNAFDAFDENRDDMITTDVLGKLLRAIGFNPMPEEVEDMILDVGAQTLDFNSFLYIVSKHARSADPEAELIDAFRVFDKRGTGKLKTDLIQKILKNLKQPFTDDQIAQLFSQADMDADGNVEYKEFVKVMLDF
jgi:calmodulin